MEKAVRGGQKELAELDSALKAMERQGLAKAVLQQTIDEATSISEIRHKNLEPNVEDQKELTKAQNKRKEETAARKARRAASLNLRALERQDLQRDAAERGAKEMSRLRELHDAREEKDAAERRKAEAERQDRVKAYRQNRQNSEQEEAEARRSSQPSSSSPLPPTPRGTADLPSSSAHREDAMRKMRKEQAKQHEKSLKQAEDDRIADAIRKAAILELGNAIGRGE